SGVPCQSNARICFPTVPPPERNSAAVVEAAGLVSAAMRSSLIRREGLRDVALQQTLTRPPLVAASSKLTKEGRCLRRDTDRRIGCRWRQTPCAPPPCTAPPPAGCPPNGGVDRDRRRRFFAGPGRWDRSAPICRNSPSAPCSP